MFQQLKLTSVIPTFTAGGIGPVCRYAAEELARHTGWEITLLSLHDSPGQAPAESRGYRSIALGLSGNCSRAFLEWLARNPQDLLLTSDVSRIEPAFPFVPIETAHVIQIHDSRRRYRNVAVRHARWVEGVICVANHIEAALRSGLDAVNFMGLLGTVQNGANFPPFIPREPYDGPLRLLFIGRAEPIKGVFDLVPLLQQLRHLRVPARLNFVGEPNETLRRRFQRKGLDDIVTWTGRVPHEECYNIAAKSDILMMTSRKEPFGMVTIEAMSMGCVPMAYDVPSGSTEIIQDGKSGWLVPLGDIQELALLIRSMHHDREQLYALSAGAANRARRAFNAEKMARHLAEFLTEVLSRRQSHRASRLVGVPPEATSNSSMQRFGYQLLPESVRRFIRIRVGKSPRLCYWLLNR